MMKEKRMIVSETVKKSESFKLIINYQKMVQKTYKIVFNPPKSINVVYIVAKKLIAIIHLR